MQFKITRTSDDTPPCPNATLVGDDWIVHIDTIEELMAFVDQVDTQLIVSKEDGPTIEIYDDYRE